MTIIYLVVSQEEFDHSYSEHTIHCITSDEEKAHDAFKSVSTIGIAGKLLLKTDSNNEWQEPFTLFDRFAEHPNIKIIDEWRAF